MTRCHPTYSSLHLLQTLNSSQDVSFVGDAQHDFGISCVYRDDHALIKVMALDHGDATDMSTFEGYNRVRMPTKFHCFTARSSMDDAFKHATFL